MVPFHGYTSNPLLAKTVICRSILRNVQIVNNVVSFGDRINLISPGWFCKSKDIGLGPILSPIAPKWGFGHSGESQFHKNCYISANTYFDTPKTVQNCFNLLSSLHILRVCSCNAYHGCCRFIPLHAHAPTSFNHGSLQVLSDRP